MKKSVTIVGAGLAGSLCALYLLKRGYKVVVYERRKDLRSEIITAGKSINLALSERGWTALKKVGADKEIIKIAIPMYKRVMHDINGELTEQYYGNKESSNLFCIKSPIKCCMMRLAEENGAKLYFNEKCIDIDFKKSKVILKHNY